MLCCCTDDSNRFLHSQPVNEKAHLSAHVHLTLSFIPVCPFLSVAVRLTNRGRYCCGFRENDYRMSFYLCTSIKIYEKIWIKLKLLLFSLSLFSSVSQRIHSRATLESYCLFQDTPYAYWKSFSALCHKNATWGKYLCVHFY